jgi:hypothetical protein
MSTKYCHDCKYCDDHRRPVEHHHCTHPTARDLIGDPMLCEVARAEQGPCGIDPKLFEAIKH